MNSRPGFVELPFEMAIVLTAADLATLTEVDGTWEKSHIASEAKTRLLDLGLIERRAWPNGALWRTAAGDRRVREGRRSD